MNSSSEHTDFPQPLKDAIQSKKCVAFIGSGLAAETYGTWSDVISLLCDKFNINPDSYDNDFLAIAEKAKQDEPTAYYNFLIEHFGGPAKSADFLYDVLFSLPFKCYLTFNYDPHLALKSKTAIIPCDTTPWAYPNLDRERMGQRSIHYLHGHISEDATHIAENTIVFAQSEFDEAYEVDSNLRSMLLLCLQNDPIVFIGCRLNEPTLPPIIEICKDIQERRQKNNLAIGRPPGNPPPRFILLPDYETTVASEREAVESDKKGKEEYYKKMDITPVWYPVRGGGHQVLRHNFGKLAKLPDAPLDYGWGETDEA